jgi:hypothetical protein
MVGVLLVIHSTLGSGWPHLSEWSIRKAVGRAVRGAGLQSRRMLRQSFARTRSRTAYDIRTVQELLGRADVRTTMIYTHVLNRGGCSVRSPLDRGDQPKAYDRSRSVRYPEADREDAEKDRRASPRASASQCETICSYARSTRAT